MMALIYLGGVCLTLALVLALLIAPFSRRLREDLVEDARKFRVVVILVCVFWFTPWGWPVGYVSALCDVARGRFFLHSIPLKVDSDERRVLERRAIANELQIRFGVGSTGMRGCFGGLPQDDEFDQGYDRFMLAALPVHFGRDIIEECRQSASKSRTAAEWLNFYFRSVKLIPTGLEVDFPERPAWWVKIDGGALDRIPSGPIKFSRKAEFLGQFTLFQISLVSWDGRDFVVLEFLPWHGLTESGPTVAALSSEGNVVEVTPEQEAAVLTSLGLTKTKPD
ncbi:hypothetical protein DB345_18715 [Spartobacteria bacterium LR76]|nr:hypothetical protein DB345_18715 [Spartobacteria bacterium LR76]